MSALDESGYSNRPTTAPASGMPAARTGLRAFALPPPQQQARARPKQSAKKNLNSEAAPGANESLTRARAERALGSADAPVFMSYQSGFSDMVLRVKRALEARGIHCWMAQENLAGDVQDGIAAALRAAPAVLICYSQSYTQSSYCKAEANAAFRWGKPLVALCVEAGYVADYWLAIVIAAAPGLECSSEAKLAACIERLERELRTATARLRVAPASSHA